MNAPATFRRHLLSRLAAASGISVTAVFLASLGGCDDGVECFDWSTGATCPDRQQAMGHFDLDCGDYVASVDSDAMQGDSDCCYEVTIEEYDNACCGGPFENCVMEGRALRLAGEARTARGVSRGGWAGELAPELDGLSDRERRALGASWTRAALAEHASIASFARFALELMALGAPADLVAAAHRAALDEVRHARACFALATAYTGAAVGPSPLDLPPALPIERDLAAFATATAIDACVNETLAVLLASEALAHTRCPQVSHVLDGIVRDETAHAELAWRTLAWAIDEGGDAVRRAVAVALGDYDPLALVGATQEPAVPAHGLLDRERRSHALVRGWREVVGPCLGALLSTPMREGRAHAQV